MRSVRGFNLSILRPSFVRVALLAALLFFSTTYLGKEFLAALILLASLAALVSFLGALLWLGVVGACGRFLDWLE